MKKQKSLPLEAELLKETKRFKEEGVETLVLSLLYPVFRGRGSCRENKEVKALLLLLEKEAAALSKEEWKRYFQNEREDKRFTYRPLRISLSVSILEEGKSLLLTYLVSVSRRGKTLASYTFKEALLPASGARIPLPDTLQKSKKILDFFFKKRYNKKEIR